MSRHKRADAPLVQLVLEHVLAAGETTIAKTAASLGRHISQAAAVNRGRGCVASDATRGRKVAKDRQTTTGMAQEGRVKIIGDCLSRLVRAGKIRWVSRGTYGPPLPAIWAEPNTAEAS